LALEIPQNSPVQSGSNAKNN